MDDRRTRMMGIFLVATLATSATLARPARADWPGDPWHFVTLTPGGRNTLIQDACPDGIGGAFVLWGTGLMVTMHLQHLDELGRPSFPGGPLDIVSPDGQPVELETDGSGGAVALLRNYVATSTVEVQLQHFGSNGNVQWTTAVGTTLGPNYFYWTHVAFDPKGPGWIVAWIDANDATDRIRVQYVDWYGTTRWATTPTLERAPGEHLALGPVRPDGLGGAWACGWNMYLQDTTVSVQHIAADGSTAWGPFGRTVVAPYNGWIQQLAVDSQGNLWLSLRASESSDPSDRIQRLRQNGSVSFGPHGIALPHPERGQRREAALGVVGPDRVFVAWTDHVTAAWTTQFQAVDSSGTWLGATRQLSTGAFGEYLGIRVFPLADGGALVDCAPGSGATFPVQRVDASGSPLWPEGTAVMNVPDNMASYEAANEVFVPPFPTGDGGVTMFRTLVDSVVTPEESHPNYVRAQHLDANGQHGVPAGLASIPHLPQPSALLAPVPSPMTSSARVRFVLESETALTLTLHDLSGRRVRTLASGRWGAGEHGLVLARDGPGAVPLHAGLYWLRLTAGGRSEARELVVLD